MSHDVYTDTEYRYHMDEPDPHICLWAFVFEVIYTIQCTSRHKSTHRWEHSPWFNIWRRCNVTVTLEWFFLLYPNIIPETYCLRIYKSAGKIYFVMCPYLGIGTANNIPIEHPAWCICYIFAANFVGCIFANSRTYEYIIFVVHKKYMKRHLAFPFVFRYISSFA